MTNPHIPVPKSFFFNGFHLPEQLEIHHLLPWFFTTKPLTEHFRLDSHGFSIGFSTFSHGFSTSAFPGFPGFQGPSRLQIQQGNPARWMCQARAHPQLVRQLNDFLHAHHLPCRQRKALMGNGHFESRISIKKREIYIYTAYIYIDTHNTYYTYYHIYYNICFSSITTGVENYW